MYRHTHTHIYTYMHIARIFSRTTIHTYTQNDHTHIYAYMYIRTYIYYLYKYIHTYTRTHTHTHLNTHTQAHSHTNTHTGDQLESHPVNKRSVGKRVSPHQIQDTICNSTSKHSGLWQRNSGVRAKTTKINEEWDKNTPPSDAYWRCHDCNEETHGYLHPVPARRGRTSKDRYIWKNACIYMYICICVYMYFFMCK